MRKIPFSPPDINDLEVNEVLETLKSGWLTTGVRTKKFESELAKYIGNTKCVCLNSATAAMEMTLRILGVGPGDEVITSAYTYTASASVIYHVGAKIVLADTKDNSFEMDYDKLENLITPKTKAIIAVDLGGRICDYQKIFELVNAKKSIFQAKNDIQQIYNRIIVIADSAHGFGAQATINNKILNSGQIADFTCYSFHAVKNLTTGEGGAVTWAKQSGLDDEKIYHQFMLYSLHGQNKDALEKTKLGSWEYDIVYPAYKCNMTDIQAAIGLKQLERYNSLLKRRKEIIEYYDSNLLNLGLTSLRHYDNYRISSGHLYLLRIPKFNEVDRNKLIINLAEKGITTNVHYKPLPMMTAYKNLGFSINDYKNAYNQYKNEITLPLHTKLSNEDIEYIVEKFSYLIKKGES